MIKLRVWGGTAEQRSNVRSMVRFAASKLLTKRMAKTLYVKVSLIDELVMKEGCFGDCIWTDQEYRPKEFLIRIDSKMKMRPLLETVAHEMVHVKQYARDEMKELVGGVNRFNGQYFTWDTEYWDQPWEIEAHGRERGLFEMWREDEGITDPWTNENLYQE